MNAALSPYVRVAWYSTLDPYTVIGPRVIFDYEILYIKEGNPLIRIGDVQYNAIPGDVFFFRPRQIHTIECCNSRPVIQPHVHFDLVHYDDWKDVFVSYYLEDIMTEKQKKLFRPDIARDLFPQIPECIHLKNLKAFEEALFALINEHSHPSQFSGIREQWQFLRLFDLYLSEISYSLHKGNQSQTEYIVSQIKLYLGNHAARSVSENELSEIVHLDKSYMIRLFKKTCGVTPLKYHQQLRISRAKEMLLFTNLTVTQIAEASGFTSIHDFDRVFRKVDGSSPSSYRIRG